MNHHTNTGVTKRHFGFLSLLPNALTLLNALAGILAIIQVALGDFILSFYLFLACLFLDFADGFVARLFNVVSSLGKQLDSLADMVSFGLYPSIAIYFALLGQGFFPQGSLIAGLVLVYPLFAMLRLAIFNTEVPHPLVFYGLPSPAAAIGVVAVVFMVVSPDSLSLFSLKGYSPVVPVVFVLLYSVLMVTRLPMISLKFDRNGWKSNRYRIIFPVLLLPLFIIFQIEALLMLIPLYIFYSLAVWAWYRKK